MKAMWQRAGQREEAPGHHAVDDEHDRERGQDERLRAGHESGDVVSEFRLPRIVDDQPADEHQDRVRREGDEAGPDRVEPVRQSAQRIAQHDGETVRDGEQ